MRGECEFVIGPDAHILRPSFERLVAVEEEIGSLFALVERASEGALTLAEVTALIWHCIDSEQRPSRSEVGAAVLERGLVNATQPVRAILGQVLQGRP
jgi:hypothetical protein